MEEGGELQLELRYDAFTMEDTRRRKDILFRIGHSEVKTQKELAQKVFMFLGQMLDTVEGYAFQFTVSKTSTSVVLFSAQEGIAFSEIVDVLKAHSKPVSDYPVGDGLPRVQTFVLEECGCPWEVGHHRNGDSGTFSHDIVFTLKDRHKELEGYFDAQQGIEYAVYPQDIKPYKKFTFNFTTGEILKDGKVQKLRSKRGKWIPATISAGTRQEKLARLLLDSRDKKFQPSDLIDFLGDSHMSLVLAEKNVRGAFDELNRKCGETVFEWNGGYFVNAG